MDWWTNAETFHISAYALDSNRLGQNGVFDWGNVVQGKFTFTTHCPIDKNFIDRCHDLGVRCFPYVTFYMGADHSKFGTVVYDTYQGVDFKQHPDFKELDQQQNPKAWAFDPTAPDGVGVKFPEPPYLVCPNYKPYQDKMVQWVGYIMQQGADGVFIDVLYKRTHCYAPHQHIYPDNPADPDAAQNQAFALLLSRVREVVKSYRSDGLIIGNSGDPLNQTNISSPEFQAYLDADTIESYICMSQPVSPGSTENWIVRQPTYFTTKLNWDQLGEMLQPYLAGGKQILVIPALGIPTQYNVPDRENAFLTYCAARVAGLTWYGLTTDPTFADLHRVRLGKPLTAPALDPGSGIRYRVFQRGIVAVNWDQSGARSFPAQSIAAAALGMAAQNFQFFSDLFKIPTFDILDTSQTSGSLQVPAFSGRVFLFATSTDYGLNQLTPPQILPPVHPPIVHPPIPPRGGPPHTIS